MPGKGHLKILLSLLLVATCVRTGVLIARGDQLKLDPDAYRQVARALASDQVFGWSSEDSARPRPTAFRPPLYPLILAPAIASGSAELVLIGLMHLMFGLATVWLTFRLGLAMNLGLPVAVAGGVLVTVDPILLNQSTLVMTETLATLLAVASLERLANWRSAGPWFAPVTTGVLLGLAVLCRPTFLPWWGLILGVQLLRTWQRVLTPRAVLLFAGASLCTLLPWALRNQAVLGVPKVTTTHGGFTLLLGNNPDFYSYLKEPAGQLWDSTTLVKAWSQRRQTSGVRDPLWDDLATLSQLPPRDGLPQIDEVADDRFAYDLARRYMRDDPPMLVWSSLVRVGRLWKLRPAGDESPGWTQIVVGLWYLSLFIFCLLACFRLRSSLASAPWCWLVLLCLSFTVVHAFYWSNMRMRAPLMPALCMLAALGSQPLLAQAKRGKGSFFGRAC